MQVDTTAYGYRVQAEDEYEAERLVLEGKAERIPEHDKLMDGTFEFEEE